MSEHSDQAAEVDAQNSQAEADAGPVATVAGAVLAEFFDELGKTDCLKDKAAELRKLVLGEGVMAEPAIRAILFPDAS
jgi:hypothetical protein